MQLDVRLLTRDESALWDALVSESAQGTIFAQRWWIDIVTHGQGQLLGCFTGARLIAGMPIYPTVTLGVSRLKQPPLTPYWGPIFSRIDGTYTTSLSTEMSILRAFADALLAWPDVILCCHPSLANWLPFFWHGYSQMTRYTYRIERLLDFPLDENAFQKSVRQKLRLARENKLTIQDGVEPKVVQQMFERTMARQGMSGEPDVLAVWPQLALAASAHDCLFTTAVYDEDGHTHTARAMVWDERCAYAIFGGSDPQYRQSGAAPYSLVHEMRVAAERVATYDFEGSIIEPIEAFFRSFGGTLTPYLMITRRSSWPLNMARAVKGWLSRRTIVRNARRSKEPQKPTGAAA